MKKFPFVILATFFMAQASLAQVAVNTDGSLPNASAMLDVKSTNKGLLVPRLALTGTADVSTISSPTVSLMIYNTASSGDVTPGYYYWNGSAWTKFNTGNANVNAWSLTGNAGTAEGVNFIGTTDSKPLEFKVNNERAGYVYSGNTSLGYQAFNLNTSGFSNSAFGYRSLEKNTTGYQNSSVGYLSLNENISGTSNVAIGNSSLTQNTTGDENCAIGLLALGKNTTQSGLVAVGIQALYNNGLNATSSSQAAYNTALGSRSLYANTNGSRNTATGFESLNANTTGGNNTANGYLALQTNTTGDNNTAIGHNSLTLATTASQNTAVGSYSLEINTNGFGNTAIGTYSLVNNVTGDYNTALGFNAGVGSAFGNLTNTTALGYGALVGVSNKVRIGNGSVTVIEGAVAYSFPSDKRFKYNIQNNVPGLEFIKRLQPVTYYFDEKKLEEYTKTGIINNSIYKPASYAGERQLHTGFLAQDVEALAKELGYHFDGVHTPTNDKDHYSLAYSQFIMPLVKAVQEQQQTIEEQKLIIKEQHKIIHEIMKRVEALEKN